MASIPNLNTLKTDRGGPRRRGGGRVQAGGGDGRPNLTTDADHTRRDEVVQGTDHDAASSRMSAVALGYLEDEYANAFFTSGQEAPRRYPIINRGTYVRTKVLDELVARFLRTRPNERKQIISLGAGSYTRFFRLRSKSKDVNYSKVYYHELDFEHNVGQKRAQIRSSSKLQDLVEGARKDDWTYQLHAIDLRDLTKKAPPDIPGLDAACPTLLLSECCLCYLPPETATSVVQYFTMHITAPMALVLYEPIRPFDAFGKTMVSNLASRGIHLQTLKQYSTLEAQRQRLRLAGFTDGQCARDVQQLWQNDQWVSQAERERVEGLEWLDEVEEWNLLASHYCVAWGWKGEVFGEAWRELDGEDSRRGQGRRVRVDDLEPG